MNGRICWDGTPHPGRGDRADRGGPPSSASLTVSLDREHGKGIGSLCFCRLQGKLIRLLCLSIHFVPILQMGNLEAIVWEQVVQHKRKTAWWLLAGRLTIYVLYEAAVPVSTAWHCSGTGVHWRMTVHTLTRGSVTFQLRNKSEMIAGVRDRRR